jgi:hypothetical protein
MSDVKIPRTLSNRKSPDVPPVIPPAAPVSPARLERRIRPRTRIGARHSAITRNLHNYASYKSWAEKIRSNWEPDEDPDS